MDHSEEQNRSHPQDSSVLASSPSSLPSVSTWILGTGSLSPRKSVVLTSSSHNVIHSQHSPSQTILSPLPDEPELRYLFTLLGALLLSTSLAAVAGVDAKEHCQSRQAYEINELFDDDAVIFSQLQRVQEEHACVYMFRYVMLPVTLITILTASLGLWRIKSQVGHLTPLNVLERQQGHFRVFIQLFWIGAILLLTWLYGIVAIMMRPRNLSSSGNPYQSLAAVDTMGHVGDNANLYYLAWISMGLALSISYQISYECIKQSRRLRLLTRQISQRAQTSQADVEAMLSYSDAQLEHYRESRTSWHHSLYRLRIRSGLWVSALLATLVVLASSSLLWRDVLAPAASMLRGKTVRVRGVCSALQTGLVVPSQLCPRTAFSIVVGGTAALVILVAIVIHFSQRHGAAQVMDDSSSCARVLNVHPLHHNFLRRQYLPLRVEFVLAVLLSLMLGLNAVFATGVQGPAATVGNLYYASWISFLLCLRVCLGCLEEVYNLGKHDSNDEGSSRATDDRSATAHPTQSVSSDVGQSSMRSSPADLFDNQRARRLRRYLLLGVFSTVCSASALDSALNQGKQLSIDQYYVIIAPAVVAILCSIQFAMCLGPISYIFIASNIVGGSLSVIMFCIWLCVLLICMHSEHSWAVNAIGDIKIANIYYFSWLSILTAGINMSTYLKKIFGFEEKDYMTIVWLATVKVCFVILGASFHIWHNIQDNCTLEDIESGAITFCSRTVFAMVISITGMLVGGAVTGTRMLISMCCPSFFSLHIRTHVEMIISVFLVLLFGVALALITGIGGPGQSVGDLYYASWLAFLVSIFIGITCYSELKQDELTWGRPQQEEEDENCRSEPHTNYVDLKE